MRRRFSCLALSLILLIVSTAWSVAEQPKRTTLSLNGTWGIADSVSGDVVPSEFTHQVPVPGLVHSAEPAFPDVDQFQSRELLSNLVRKGTYPADLYKQLQDVHGISHQARNYFWYHKSFNAPAKAAVAILKISKAQFGAVIFLNGVRVGEHAPCFTAVYLDVTRAIHWNAANDLLIRIGAHPGVLPANVSQGTDFEKNRWTPGIYDDVTLVTMNNPVITTVQVAPRLEQSEAVIRTELHNYSSEAISTTVTQHVSQWKLGTSASTRVKSSIALAPGETKVLLQTVSIQGQHLWSPEDPFLYIVDTESSGDAVTTRFGMREFRFDSATQRAYLNGKPYFLRGSNITLHRFFEDPESGTLPWDKAWVQKLLVDIPKSMHWNTFRFCIGPVPDHWLDVADEAGLLIENEYMVWVGHPSWRGLYQDKYDPDEMITEYKEWMRDDWNHPSVAIWDASNESYAPEFAERIVPAVRGLDLSDRPWEDGYNAPNGANDPVEDHQYLFLKSAVSGKLLFKPSDLEQMLGPAPNDSTPKSSHATILNEYGWLWLNRDGSPTLLTKQLYPLLLGPDSTAEQRFAEQAYLLGGETEFWRAYRRYAGVLHFVYLTSSDPQGFTADHFRDVRKLELEPHFEEAMRRAFMPVGIYLNFWKPELEHSTTQDFSVSMVNDTAKLTSGILYLDMVAPDGHVQTLTQTAFSIPSLGGNTYTLHATVTGSPGSFSLQARAVPNDAATPSISRRRVVVR